MRTGALFLVTLGLGAAATAGSAQMLGGCGPLALSMPVGVNLSKVPPPFSATVKTTFEQKLADGNSIHGSATAHQARDSSGRTRQEASQGCTVDADGQNKPEIGVMVIDPVANKSFSWRVDDPANKFVRVAPMQIPQSALHTPAVLAERQAASRAANQKANQKYQSERRTENLGTKDIAGVLAEGSRIVRTIPAGEEGNDNPIETIDETWFANDLKLTMLTIHDDPRSGRTTREVTELNQTEPDAALFAPPAGYAIEEQVMMPVSVAGTK